MSSLSKEEITRLRRAVQAVFGVPFIDDIEDFIWEAVFAYAKNIPLTDPLIETRSKRLFDLVDPKTKTGWSAKALQCQSFPPKEFELVIQRADIFKKAKELGYKSLTKDTPLQKLGDALHKHWYEWKVQDDAVAQGVEKKRICVLVKSGDRRKFAFFEEGIGMYRKEDLTWRWTDSTKTGLQGVRKSDGFCVFRWYPNQKQLFERFVLPKDALIFELEPKRIPLEELVGMVAKRLGTP